MIIIVKNQTSDVIPINDCNYNLMGNMEVDLLTVGISLSDIQKSDDIPKKIALEKIVINNGERDLSITEAIQYVSINNIIQGPKDRSGKLRTQDTPRPLHTLTCFTSFGDKLEDPLDIGSGQVFEIIHTAGESDLNQQIYMDFNCVENETWIYKGSVNVENSIRDQVVFEMVPRTTYITTSETPTPYRLYNNYSIVPAALPFGPYVNVPDIVDGKMLSYKGLVYAPLDDDGNRPTGFWNADWDSTSFINITPALNLDGHYNMFSVEITFVKFINSLINGSMIKTFDSKDVDEIGHGTRFKISAITRGIDHDWSMTGELLLYRNHTI